MDYHIGEKWSTRGTKHPMAISSSVCMMTPSNGNIFPRYWHVVRGIRRSSLNSPHKGQWRWALMFSLICAWINGWINNREAGDFKGHRVHYDATVMWSTPVKYPSWEYNVDTKGPHGNKLKPIFYRKFQEEPLLLTWVKFNPSVEN